MAYSKVNFASAEGVPFTTEVIGQIARSWPFRMGHYALDRLALRTLNSPQSFRRITLKDSRLNVVVPWQDRCGCGLITYRTMDEDLRMFLKSSFDELKGEDHVFVDIGANLGEFSLRAAADFSVPTIAYEPQPDLVNLLNFNSEQNHIAHLLTVRPIALSNKDGRAPLEISNINSGNSMLLAEATPGSIEVEVRRADSDIDPMTWKKVKLLKIDVEGHELEAFIGMAALFRHNRPSIIFEVNMEELPKRGSVPKEVGDLLRSVGYSEFYVLDKKLYPVRNGVYVVSNIVAPGDGGERFVRAYGYSEQYVPFSSKRRPLVHYEL